MKNKGLFIVFEGLDQSGKKTLSLWLEEHLNQNSFKARRYAFPNYNSAIGSLIQQYLSRKIDLSIEARHLLFAADRWQLHSEMKDLLDSGVFIVCDRYSSSGIAYGMAHCLEQSWLESLEIGLLVPDLVFFVDIPPIVSVTRKPDNRDLYEQKTELLEHVRASYLRLAQEKRWIVLNGDTSLQNLQQDVLKHLILNK